MKVLRQVEQFGYRLAMPALDDPDLTKPAKLYRGLAIHSVPPEQAKRWSELTNYDNWDGDKASLGTHLKVGPEIIKHLEDVQGGVGRHWTTNPVRAYDFAGRSMENMPKDLVQQAFPAVLEMNWDGTGLDMSDKGMASPSHNYDVDDERVLQKGLTAPISGVKVRGGAGSADWGDVLNPPKDDYDFGHLHRPDYGHPGVI